MTFDLSFSEEVEMASSPNRVPALHLGSVTYRTPQNIRVRVALPGQRLLAEGRPADRSVPGCSGLQRALLSVSSAQKHSGAERLATPSGVSRALVHLSPASMPFQDTELAALITPEVVIRLVALVDYFSAWKLLPNVSFRYASVEPLSHATEVQNDHTHTGRVSDQVWRLVCHDRSKRRIIPYLHPFHSQEVPEVCFRGKAYQYWVLSFWLALSPRTFTECVECVDAALAPLRLQGIRILNYINDWLIAQSEQLALSASRYHSCPYKRVEVKTYRQEECAFSGSKNHLSGCGVGFNQQHSSNDFMNYFTSKINTIRDQIWSMQPSATLSHQIVQYR